MGLSRPPIPNPESDPGVIIKEGDALMIAILLGISIGTVLGLLVWKFFWGITLWG